MKILVVGVNGRVGSLVCEKAIKRGIDVFGLGRGDNKNNLINYFKKDALSLSKEELARFDAVVDAVGGWDENSIQNIPAVMIHLANLLSGTKTRFIVVGGAGSLFLNSEHNKTVDMKEDFPDSWKPLSSAHSKGLAYLKKTIDLNWTYISPACNFVADGEATNEYKIGKEELLLNSNFESIISYRDYALALVDELHLNQHNKERISVVSK